MQKIAIIQCHHDGDFNKIDQASAWLGFQKLEYDVKKISYEKLVSCNSIKDLNIGKIDCGFGHINFTRKLFELSGMQEPEFDNVPFDGLNKYQLEMLYKRKIDKIKAKDFVADKKRYFIKPVKLKQFEPFEIDALNGIMKARPISNTGYTFIPDLETLKEHGLNPDDEIIVSQFLSIDSEWRVYVLDGEILKISNYKGDPTDFPCCNTIDLMNYNLKSIQDTAYPTYSFDVAKTSNKKTVLIECHDFWSLGNYGLDPEDYALGLKTRWKDIERLCHF